MIGYDGRILGVKPKMSVMTFVMGFMMMISFCVLPGMMMIFFFVLSRMFVFMPMIVFFFFMGMFVFMVMIMFFLTMGMFAIMPMVVFFFLMGVSFVMIMVMRMSIKRSAFAHRQKFYTFDFVKADQCCGFGQAVERLFQERFQPLADPYDNLCRTQIFCF